MRQGQKIPKLAPGELIGTDLSNQVIDTCNAFLNMRVKPKGKLTVSNQNSVLDTSVDDTEGSASDSTSGFFHPFKVYRVDGAAYNVFQVRGGLFEHRPMWSVSAGELGGEAVRPLWYANLAGSDGVVSDASGWDWFTESQAAPSPEAVTVSNSGDHTVSNSSNAGQFTLNTDLDDEGRVRASVWLEVSDPSGGPLDWFIKMRMWATFPGTTGRTGDAFPTGPRVIPLALIDARDPSSPPVDATDLIVDQIRNNHVLDRYGASEPTLYGLSLPDIMAPMRFRGLWNLPGSDEWGLNNKVMYPGDTVGVFSTGTDSNGDTINLMNQFVALQTFVMSSAPSTGAFWQQIGGSY